MRHHSYISLVHCTDQNLANIGATIQQISEEKHGFVTLARLEARGNTDQNLSMGTTAAADGGGGGQTWVVEVGLGLEVREGEGRGREALV